MKNAPITIALAGRKGGIGKTTLTLAIAARLARAKKRVVVLDLDPQGSLMLALSGVEWPNVTPLPVNPKGITKATLRAIDADVVLLDCPPAMPLLDVAISKTVHAMLVLAEAHIFAIAGAMRLLEDLPAKTRSALVLNRLDERRSRDRLAKKQLGALGVPLFTIRSDGPLVTSIFKGKVPAAVGRSASDLRLLVKWILSLK